MATIGNKILAPVRLDFDIIMKGITHDDNLLTLHQKERDTLFDFFTGLYSDGFIKLFSEITHPFLKDVVAIAGDPQFDIEGKPRKYINIARKKSAVWGRTISQRIFWIDEHQSFLSIRNDIYYTHTEWILNHNNHNNHREGWTQFHNYRNLFCSGVIIQVEENFNFPEYTYDIFKKEDIEKIWPFQTKKVFKLAQQKKTIKYPPILIIPKDNLGYSRY